MNRNRKITATIILLISFLMLAMACFSSVNEKKDSWQYYLDSDYQLDAELVEMMGWLFTIFTFIMLGVLLALLASKQDRPTGANLMACPDCGKTVSRNAVSCPHCGRAVRRPSAEYGRPKMYSGDWKCGCGRVNPSYVSSCTCGRNKQGLEEEETASVQWWVCEHCKSGNPPSDQNCVRCGAAKPQRMNDVYNQMFNTKISCPECGCECPPEVRFCPGCGTRLRS